MKFTNDQDLEKFSSLTHFGFQERRASRQRRRAGPGPAVPAGGRPPGPELDQAPVAGRGQRLQQEPRHVQVKRLNGGNEFVFVELLCLFWLA